MSDTHPRPSPRCRSLAFAALALPVQAALAAPECPGGLLGVAAQVVSIEPPGASLLRTTAQQRMLQAVAGQHLCPGDTVALPATGRATSAMLHASGQRKPMLRGQSWTLAAAGSVGTSAAAAMLDRLQLPEGGLRVAPDVPQPRLVRAGGDAAAGPALQLTRLRTLRDLPRQALTHDAAPVLAWREGVGPYTCDAVSAQGEVIISRSVDQRDSWCLLPPGGVEATQLLVRESRGPSVTWNLRWVGWADVPRPPGLPSLAPTDPSAERAAWALWLWREAPPVWRLQGLAMMQELSPHVWVAAYARDLILADQWLQSER